MKPISVLAYNKHVEKSLQVTKVNRSTTFFESNIDNESIIAIIFQTLMDSLKADPIMGY